MRTLSGTDSRERARVCVWKPGKGIVDKRLFIDGVRGSSVPKRNSVAWGKMVVVIIVTLSLFASALVSLTSDKGFSAEAEFMDHPPIFINGDADFALKAVSNFWPGDGSSGNPYVISGYAIDGGTDGIVVSNTAYHFVIRDCYVYDSDSSDIFISYALNGELVNNTLTDSIYGMRIEGSPNAVVKNNTCSGARGYGILLFNSDGCVVMNNAVSDSNTGIWISTNGVQALGNRLDNCTYGAIWLSLAQNAVLSENVMTGCGVSLWGDEVAQWNSHTIDLSNTVNGKSVYYFKDENSNKPVGEAGQVIYVNCQGMTLDSKSLRNCTIGVEVAFCTRMTITNCDCSDNYEGIDVAMSTKCTITSNNFSNSDYGLGIFSSTEIGMTGNKCNNCSYGIYLDNSDDNTIEDNEGLRCEEGLHMYNSWTNIVRSNDFRSSHYGVYLDFSCSENTFEYNNLSYCECGIYANVANGDDYNTFSYNNITEPGEGGMYFSMAVGDTITGNLIVGAEWGIVISDCTEFVCQDNVFSNSGFWLSGYERYQWTSHVIDGTNTVDGKPVFYAKNTDSPAIPTDAGQILLAGCNHSSLKDIEISNTSVGIAMGFCNNASIENIQIVNNSEGLYAYGCNWSSFNSSRFDGNGWAIDLDVSENNTVWNNTLSNSTFYGMGMLYSKNNTIVQNRFVSSGEHGLRLSSCDDNRIWNNTFDHNNGAGDAYDPAHVQAYDDWGDNIWYESAPDWGHGFGNYWSDWTTPDDNSDYIVDQPYELDGGSSVSDLYPLTMSEVPPVYIHEFSPAIVAALVVMTFALVLRKKKS